MNEKTMNMNLEEFTEHVAEKLKTKMPQLEIKTVQQEKNNGVSKWGIRMGKIKNGEGWSASPIVYLDDIYSRVQKKEQIEILHQSHTCPYAIHFYTSLLLTKLNNFSMNFRCHF